MTSVAQRAGDVVVEPGCDLEVVSREPQSEFGAEKRLQVERREPASERHR